MVRDHHHEPAQASPEEDGLEHEDVGQVHAARIGIVEDHDIAGRQVFAEPVHDDLHGVGHRAKVQRHRLGLGEYPALAVADGDGIIQHVAHDRGTRGAHHRIGHVVYDRVEGILENGEGDRIEGWFRHGRLPHASVTSRLPVASGSAVAATETTTVQSPLSRIAGPATA